MLNSTQIVSIDLDQVYPYDNTPRLHNRTKLRKLRRLIEQYGQLPIVVDERHAIIDGHAVYEVLREMGVARISAIVVAGQSPGEIKALRLALNRVSSEAGWDRIRLAREFTDLLELKFDLDFTGFDVPEVDSILEIDAPQANLVEDAALPEVPEHPVSRRGEIWLLDTHRIACADSLRDTALVKKLLDGKSAVMAIEDLPYNLPINGVVSRSKAGHREFLQASGELSPAQFQEFLDTATMELKPLVAADALVFLFMDWRHAYEVMLAGRRAGLDLVNLCVWVKTNAGMGSLYRSQHELIFVFGGGDTAHRNNIELGRHGRNRSNVWTYRGQNSFGAGRDELLAQHPTPKPIALLADAMRDVSARGDAILDRFLGSGSTLIAAEDTGRHCFGVEIDPRYVDVAIERWQKHTGRDAILAASGLTFGEVAENRRQEIREISHAG